MNEKVTDLSKIDAPPGKMLVLGTNDDKEWTVVAEIPWPSETGSPEGFDKIMDAWKMLIFKHPPVAEKP